MTKSKETFLSKSILGPTLPPVGGCFPIPTPPWPLPFPMPFPNDLVTEGLASRAAFHTVTRQLPTLLKLPPEAQEAIIAAHLEGLQKDGLLTASEVESLRGVSEGRAFTVPLFNPDGSPSLCGVLGRLLMPSPERSTSGAILGAVVGAGVGSWVGGPVGAMLGALGGGIAGSFLQ